MELDTSGSDERLLAQAKAQGFEPRRHIIVHLGQRLRVEVDHVAALVVFEADIAAQLRGQTQVRGIEFGAVERGRRIVIPVQEQHFHLRIGTHGIGQVHPGIG